MFNKIIRSIKKFFLDVFSDITKIDYKKLFSSPNLILILLAILIVVVLVFYKLGVVYSLKGITLLLIFYFLFAWRQ